MLKSERFAASSDKIQTVLSRPRTRRYDSLSVFTQFHVFTSGCGQTCVCTPLVVAYAASLNVNECIPQHSTIISRNEHTEHLLGTMVTAESSGDNSPQMRLFYGCKLSENR